MSEPVPWHRLFGLSLVDFLRGLPVAVELEKDLSLRQQLLDVAIIVTDPSKPLPRTLPDGLEDLGPHNLITFKSFHEALGGWALDEFVSYFVNYRKQVSPSMNDLLALEDFNLYAVCVHLTKALAREARLRAIQPGVYETNSFTRPIRIVTISELPPTVKNAMFLLFSDDVDQVQYGELHYRKWSSDTSTLLEQLTERYQLEAPAMPEGMQMLKEFVRQRKEEMLREMTSEERLKGLTPEERLKGLPPEALRQGLLAALSPEERAALARMLTGDGTAPL